MPNEAVQTGCPASHGTDHIITEALGENLSAAMGGTTDETSDCQVQFDPSARTRQIGNHSRIATMNTTGGGSAVGACAILGSTVGGNDNRVADITHLINV